MRALCFLPLALIACVSVQDVAPAEHTIVIEAPVDLVWRYASDSSRAGEWSVYFHHISALDDNDGAIGATRRCFREADETGKRWDEVVIALEPQRRRTMRVFNLHGYGSAADLQTFEVDQIYEPLSGGRTALTFRTNLLGPDDLAAKASFVLSRREVERIFRDNLINIGSAIEGRERVHAYDEP